jgi:hypothetical protein
MRSFLLFLAEFVCTATYGNDTLHHNSIIVSAGNQVYFNGFNVDNPKNAVNPLRLNNTLGRDVGIGYEHKSHSGFIIGLSVRYGVRNHDITLFRDYSNFDPEALNNLKGKTVSANESFSSAYISPIVLIGYQKKIDEQWSIFVKGGASMNFLLREHEGNVHETRITYLTDDGTQVRTADLMAYQLFYTQSPQWPYYGPNDNKRLLSYRVDAGVERAIDKRILKTVQIAVEVSRVMFWRNYRNKLNESFVNSYASWSEYNSATRKQVWYVDRNVSIGLRVAVCLWR